jgi:hypothetical protein
MVAKLQKAMVNSGNVSSPKREATSFRMVHLSALLLVVTSALLRERVRNILENGTGLEELAEKPGDQAETTPKKPN